MMRLMFTIAITLFCAASTLADWCVSDVGAWPKTWPAELEPLRDQADSMQGGLVNLRVHRIPFENPEAFEAAWPHLLKVKSKGAPVVLIRSSHKHWSFGETKAGVIIHCPPDGDRRTGGEEPIEGAGDFHSRWLKTYYIELIVDGEVVDLNRIALPGDTPIVDRRFEAVDEG